MGQSLTTMERTKYLKISVIFAIVLNLSTAVQAFDRAQCSKVASALYNEAGNVTFLRDQYGRPTNNFSDAWGISYETCNNLCTAESKLIDWSPFTNRLVSWLLPSLMLLVQLPFRGLQELLLAIGSPILMIYSLAVTILNSRSIKRAFREVEEDNRSLKRPEQIKLIKSAQRVLIQSQNIPIGSLNAFKRDLAHLVVKPENWAWWSVKAEKLTAMMGGPTASLMAQISWLLLALCILTFEIVTSEEVDPKLGTGLAISCLWLWLVPVTFGWSIAGGTRFTKFILSVREREDFELPGFQTILKIKTPDSEARIVPNTFGRFSVIEAESESGSLFNYARVWSHMRTSARVIEAFRNFTHRQKQEISMDGMKPWNIYNWNANLGGTPDQRLKYISAYGEDPIDLPLYDQYSPEVLFNCIKAAVVALTLGWATTGGSLVISYMTPPIGLDCRSASFLIYGVASTVAWIYLVTSAYLSDLYVHHNEAASFDPLHLSILAAAAIFLRICGKTLAIMNASFVLVTSIVQFTTLDSSCWCSSAVLSLGKSNSWVVLFASDSQIAAVSEKSWIIGVSMSGIASVVMLAFIMRFRADSKDQDEELPRIEGEPPNGLKRVRWKCACGEILYDDYKELRTGAAEELEKSLREWQLSARFIRSRNYQTATGKARDWVAAIKKSLSLTGQQLKFLKRNQQSTLVQTQPRYYSEDRATRAPAHPSGDILYLLLCHNAGVGAEIVKLRQPDVCDIDTDQRVFQCLQDEYYQLRKRWWSHTSLWTLQSIKFARFGLFSNNVIDIRKLDEVPPLGRDHEYRFEHPNPPDLEPPLGPKLLMHSFKHPECTGTGRRCLRMIPRRLNQRLALAPDDSDIVGWGLQFIEGWSKKRLVYTSGILCGLGSLLVLILMSVLGKDIQNAAAIASFILTFVTAGIATLQVGLYMT